MILEEETFEAFGYYPSELKPQSAKKILAACDDCGKVRVTSKNTYRALCRSCAHEDKHRSEKTKIKTRGKTPWNKDKHLSDEHKRKISEAQKGRQVSEETRKKLSEAGKGNKRALGTHPSEETRQKLREARKRQKPLPQHHTKPELIFESICKKYNLPFKYTGDSSFWIENINPDFVECNGKKIAVEVFGDAFHSPLFTFKKTIPYNQTYDGRKKILKKYGWKLIVFWESDLLRGDVERFVISELKMHSISPLSGNALTENIIPASNALRRGVEKE